MQLCQRISPRSTMIDLTNRELASIILVTAFIGALLGVPRFRPHGISTSLANLLQAFFAWRIQFILLSYLMYAVAIIFIASLLGIWRPIVLKETLIVILGAGLPM